jgi:hypothetical protein
MKNYQKYGSSVLSLLMQMRMVFCSVWTWKKEVVLLVYYYLFIFICYYYYYYFINNILLLTFTTTTIIIKSMAHIGNEVRTSTQPDYLCKKSSVQKRRHTVSNNASQT